MRAGTNAESSNLLEAPSADQFAPLEDAKLLGGGATPGSVAANAMKRGAWLDEADDLASQCQGSKRVIQCRFNVSVPRARVSKPAPTLRERSER